MKEQNIKKAATWGSSRRRRKEEEKQKRRGGKRGNCITQRDINWTFFCFCWNLSRTEREGERKSGREATYCARNSLFPSRSVSSPLSLSLSQCLPSLSRLALEARFIICCNWSLNRRPPTCLTAQGKIVEMCVENLADVLLIFGKVLIIRITRSSDCQQLKRQGKQNMWELSSFRDMENSNNW